MNSPVEIGIDQEWIIEKESCGFSRTFFQGVRIFRRKEQRFYVVSEDEVSFKEVMYRNALNKSPLFLNFPSLSSQK